MSETGADTPALPKGSVVISGKLAAAVGGVFTLLSCVALFADQAREFIRDAAPVERVEKTEADRFDFTTRTSGGLDERLRRVEGVCERLDERTKEHGKQLDLLPTLDLKLNLLLEQFAQPIPNPNKERR